MPTLRTITAVGLAGVLAAATLNAAGPTITVFGCVQREADYLKGGRANPSTPGVVGTSGDNELVLVYASSTTELRGGGALGTSGDSYQLVGPMEIQLEQYLGQRVELTGIVHTDPIGTNGPSGGPHAMVQPRNQQLVASLVDLRVLEVLSSKPAIGACPVS
jgi:hypothetical protein